MLIYFKIMITKKCTSHTTSALKCCIAIVNKKVACYFFSTSSLDNPQKDVTR